MHYPGTVCSTSNSTSGFNIRTYFFDIRTPQVVLLCGSEVLKCAVYCNSISTSLSEYICSISDALLYGSEVIEAHVSYSPPRDRSRRGRGAVRPIRPHPPTHCSRLVRNGEMRNAPPLRPLCRQRQRSRQAREIFCRAFRFFQDMMI